MTECATKGGAWITQQINFYFLFHNQIWDKGDSGVRVNQWPTSGACNNRDDVFAECVDVICMDTLLSEYLAGDLGTSLVLVWKGVERESKGSFYILA